MLEDIEISAIIADEGILDLRGEELDKFVAKYIEEFKKSPIGEALNKEGYMLHNSTIYDCELLLSYRK